MSANDLYSSVVRDAADTTPIQVSPCPACTHDMAVPRFRVEGIESPVVACAACGLGRYHPMLGPAQVRAFYPANYYGEPGKKFRPFIERAVRLVGARHIRFISSQLPPGARVLDVGCGRGVLLGPLADLGFEAHGVELSEDATRGIDPRARIRIASSLTDASYDSEQFDMIVLWHVLEHLADPLETMTECHRILKVGGRVLVALPNFSSLQAQWAGPDWFHLDAPRHLFHFSLRGLRALLERAGFTCKSTHHFSLRQNPFGWIQSALNRFSSRPRNDLYAFLYANGERSAFGKLRAWTIFALLSLPALALSVAAAALRNGATVHVVGVREQ